MSKFKYISFPLFIGTCIIGVQAQQRKDNVQALKKYEQLITTGDLSTNLYFLASDELEGRETGTRGQRAAAKYIASWYRSIGIDPKVQSSGGVDNDPLSPYLQPFPVYKYSPKSVSMEVRKDGKVLGSGVFSGEQTNDLFYYQKGVPENFSGGVVFAGYGISDSALHYDDLQALKAKNINMAGKWVLIFADEPLTTDGNALLPTPGRKPSKWSSQTLLAKQAAIWLAGKARGILMISDASPLRKTPFMDRGKISSSLTQMIGSLSVVEPTGYVPVYMVSSKMADLILSEGGVSAASLQQRINTSLQPEVFEVKNTVVETKAVPYPTLETQNVAAFIEGSDPKLKSQVIIISAHYDHLGIDPQLKGDQIFNGAADDGSGTVAVMSLAKAFMQAKKEGNGPRRSVLFVNFTGEEKGLLGSSYYVNSQPLVPLDQTVMDINMDGAGGLDPKHPTKSVNYVYTVFSPAFPTDPLAAIIQSAKNLTGNTIDITASDGATYSSDNLNFGFAFVPFIYFTSGLTEHYHKLSDEPSTIDYNHLANVTKLVFSSAWGIANQETLPVSADRKKMRLTGYYCRPCGLGCDAVEQGYPGVCPACGMQVIKKYNYTDK